MCENLWFGFKDWSIMMDYIHNWAKNSLAKPSEN